MPAFVVTRLSVKPRSRQVRCRRNATQRNARQRTAPRGDDTHCKIKGKERNSIYVAPFCTKVHTKRSGMDHTVLPANDTMPAFLL